MTAEESRALDFLHESNAIEDITNIDYRQAGNAHVDRGHFGAYADSQSKARSREALSIDVFCQWQRWLTEEQVSFGHPLPSGGAGTLRSPEYPRNVRVGSHIAPSFEDVPELLRALLLDLNTRIARLPDPVEDVDIADTLGEFFQRFEAIHPFVDGNGRTGRLLANYITTACRIPIVVFRLSERDTFYAAHRSKMAMRVFMADKIREAIYWPGRGLLERQQLGSSSDIYDGLVVERHGLLRKQREWREMASR